MEQFINRFDGEQSPQHNPGDEFAHLSHNSLPSSTPQAGTPSPPPHGMPTDKQELLQELGQLTRHDLLEAVLHMRSLRFPQIETHSTPEAARAAKVNSDASTRSGSDWGPEYSTRQLAQMGGVSRQAIALRVHNLVDRCWLEPRCTGRWTFGEEEARIILRNPHNRGPLKKYSA